MAGRSGSVSPARVPNLVIDSLTRWLGSLRGPCAASSAGADRPLGRIVVRANGLAAQIVFSPH
jgi:hypothetical protein